MAERPKKILIVGSAVSGLAVARRLRQLSKGFDITLIDRSSKPAWKLPEDSDGSAIWSSALPYSDKEEVEKEIRANILLQHEVIRIDRISRQLTVRNLKKNTKSILSYDRLILCTGSSPIRPHIEGIHAELVKTVRTLEDVDILLQLIEKRNRNFSQHPIVIIGGTPIGLALTETFRNRDLPVVLLEAANQVLIGADYEMLAPLHRNLQEHSVQLMFGISVSKFVQESEDEIVLELSDSQTIPARFVVIAAGVRPEVSLALDAGLELGITGGIRVNDRMQTDDPDIYAIGDVAEISVRCGNKNVPTRLSQVGAVYRQAKIVAKHLHGFRHHPYESYGGTFLCRIFEMAFAQTGFSEKQLRREMIPYEKIYVRVSRSVPDIASSEALRLKVLFSPEDGKLYGAEAAGKEYVGRQIDVLASVLRFGGTVRQLCDLELGFSPFDLLHDDPICLVGNIGSDLLDGLIRNTARKEIKRMKPGQVLLDLRSTDDFKTETIPGSVSMPLSILETKIDKLDKEKEYLLSGYDGQDGYFACRLLIQNGFKAKNFSGGFWVYRDLTGEHFF